MKTQPKSTLEQSYDEVPYGSLSYPETHPPHMAVLARLFGLFPPDIRRARVLELGCSGGGNLAPLALSFPEAQFLGIDFSQAAINEANALKNFAQLKNVEFLRADIMEFDLAKHKEAFDYIICHGVFSWVPPAVREKVLDLCGTCLSKNGLAQISYNALPGWNAVRSVREILMHHASKFPTPREKIKECRALLDFLADNGTTSSGYRTALNDERNLLKRFDDFYFFHDHLTGENNQFYFRDFMAMAHRRGLAYVGDAQLPQMFSANLDPPLDEMLKKITDLIEHEQYMDYVTNRRFRSTILCRNGQALKRQIDGRIMLDFYLTANMSPKADTGIEPSQPITFVSGNRTFVSKSEHDNVLLLELISNGYRPIAPTELVARAQAKLGLKDKQPLMDALQRTILPLVMRGFIVLHADSPPAATVAAEKPAASPIARFQSEKPDAKHATSLFRRGFATELAINIIMRLFDGTRTIAQVSDAVADMLRQGALLGINGKRLTGEEAIRTQAKKVTDDAVAIFLGKGFFLP